MTARVQAAAKVCEGCDAEFERRRFPNGRLEDVASFSKRRFCSRACYRKAGIGRPEAPVPGVWVHGPHELSTAQSAADGSGMRQAVGLGYPWDRKQAPRPVPIPGPFPAERQTNFPETRQEAP